MLSNADPIARRFVRVGARNVHLRILGAGPPALFIHSSPADSTFVIPEMQALADRYTCFAFDTPGFGLSDPLPGDVLTIADLADATAEAMVAIGLPRCPVYGTHTGAAIALELGARHPERVAGLMIDAVPIFTAEEGERLVGGGFPDFAPDPLGGHFARIWTRLRDQSIWFPWFARRADQLNPYDLAKPEVTHRWMLMFFNAQRHYKAAYSAAMRYGDDAITAIRALDVPAIFTAGETDMLHPHIARMPPLKPFQSIRSFGSDPAAKKALIGEAFNGFAVHGAAPRLESVIDNEPGRQFLDLDHGPVFVRHAGDRAGRPLLLLHDVPGSSLALGPLIGELAADRFVIAPDLPGGGESVPLSDAPSIGAYADMLAALLDRIGIDRCDIVAVGFSTSLALAFARAHPDRADRLALSGLLLPDEKERRALAEHQAPPIVIEPDGAHWFRLWQQLRDGLIWWPWFVPTLAAQRRVPADFGAVALSDATVQVMRQHLSYGHLIAAALAHDAAADLAALDDVPIIFSGPATPLSKAYDDHAIAIAPNARFHEYGPDLKDFAAVLADVLAR